MTARVWTPEFGYRYMIDKVEGVLERPRLSPQYGTMSDVDEPPELQNNGHWGVAVWALRVGYVGLAVAIAGLIVMLLGSTPWVLAVGAIVWLAAAAVTLAGFLWSRHDLPEPRPGYWSMRFMLIHDTVHARSSAQRS